MKYLGIVGWFVLEKATGRDIFNEIWLLQAPSNVALDNSRVGTSTPSLGKASPWI